MTIIPDLLWYIQAGKDKGINGRCPFATVESCPRYYQSLSLLGEAGSTKIEPHPVEVACPKCEQKTTVPVDTFPGSNVLAVCPSCNQSFRVIRTVDGHDIRDMQAAKTPALKSTPQMSEEVIEQVRASLPRQPWPVGTHKIVAATLHLPPRVVIRAINELIRRRVCNPQVDGIMYVPSTSTDTKDK